MAKTLTERIMVQMLAGRKCVCGEAKGRGKSHCRGCYFALSPEQRQALYRRLGEGYEQAFMATIATLKAINRVQDDFKFNFEG